MKEGKPRAKGGPAGPKRGVSARRLAVEVLIQVDQEKSYANLALAQAFRRARLSDRDRAFATALVQGVLRHRTALDLRIGRHSRKPVEKLAVPLRNILRLAVFQLAHMPDIPPSAVVDTANELARLTGHRGTAGYANAVLRALLRDSEPESQQVLMIEDGNSLAAMHSMPPWLTERWLTRWGEAETECLLKHSQRIPELALRTNEMAVTVEGLKSALASHGIRTRVGELVPSTLIVEERGRLRGPVERLPGFAEGLFSVQDEAASFVSIVVAPQPGDFVLDLCAAPGGKSLHMAELMQGRGRIVAVDSHTGRLNLLRKNRQRLGLTNIELTIADASTLVLPEPADRVLVDAPCSGTGVINRRTDMRFHRQAPDIETLVAVQRAILANAASLVKPGGVLVYSTCSIEPEENEGNLAWFLAQHPGFRPDSLAPFVPEPLQQKWRSPPFGEPCSLASGLLQLMPSRHGTSGFFIARLLRTA